MLFLIELPISYFFMNSMKSAILSGAIAAIIAIVVIVVASSLGALGTTSGSLGSTSNPAGSGGSSQSGTLAVLMTDPPTVPNGVTAVFITYADLAIHVSNAGNNTGWHVLNTQGQINLMGIINVTQTVATANIQSGTFNALAFNITSSTVTYKGANYTADFVYGHNMLYVPITGGIRVQSGVTSAAVIDMTPTVLLLTNGTTSSNFSFAFIPYAKAYTIPAQSTINMHLQIGGKDDIQNAPWWLAVEHNTRFEITTVSLTPNSLSITVQNTGNASVLFRVAAVSTTTSASGGFVRIATGSEFFAPEANASLSAITAFGKGQAASKIAADGYLLAPGAGVTFTYSGQITVGLTWVHPQTQATGVQIGNRYIVTLSGNGQYAQTSVLATSSS
jgi:hypothetical protein